MQQIFSWGHGACGHHAGTSSSFKSVGYSRLSFPPWSRTKFPKFNKKSDHTKNHTDKRDHRVATWSDVCWSPRSHLLVGDDCGFTAPDRNLGSGPPATSFHKFHSTLVRVCVCVCVFRFLPIGTRLKLSSSSSSERVKWGERQLYHRDKTDTIDRGTVCKCATEKLGGGFWSLFVLLYRGAH